MTPIIAASDIIYQEWFASGHSQKNLLTRFGGARNCLRLVVTRDVLWITSWFPFSMIAAFYDLEHVIPRDRILSIRRTGVFLFPAIEVTFITSDGEKRGLKLWPWRRNAFLRSLGGETPSVEPSPAP